MGFETFRVELRGGPATYADADAAVRQLPHARPDPDAIPSQGSAYYLVEGGRHVMEVEVADSPVRVSCRFTLCHPPSADAAFLGLVRDMQRRLGMEATICDDVRPEHADAFPPDRYLEFARVAAIYIAHRRAEWVAQFGPAQMAATTPEVYEKMILPRCVPVAG